MVQEAFANSLSAKHMNSKTCAQKGMYTKYVKENHTEMYDRKWETFNEAKVIFHREHVFAADQKTTLFAVILDYLMHHWDAQGCEKNATRVLQTIAEWGRQMATSLVSSQNIPGRLEFWQCVLLTGLEVLRL